MSPGNAERTLAQLLMDAAESLFPDIDPPPDMDINARDAAGDTALHVYLWRGDETAARALIAHGADVNAIGDMGETPLHVAMRHAGPGTLAALLAAGSRRDVISEFQQTPRDVAVEAGRLAAYEEALSLARAPSGRHGPAGPLHNVHRAHTARRRPGKRRAPPAG